MTGSTMKAITGGGLSLIRGHTYRAKRPRRIGRYFNDRQILYVDDYIVQYDGPAIGLGKHYPKVSRDQFLRWADRDITDETPDDGWNEWPRR